MTKIFVINDSQVDYICACGSYVAGMPIGLSIHSFEPNGADEFVFGPPEVQYPYGSLAPIVDNKTYVFYVKEAFVSEASF